MLEHRFSVCRFANFFAVSVTTTEKITGSFFAKLLESHRLITEVIREDSSFLKPGEIGFIFEVARTKEGARDEVIDEVLNALRNTIYQEYREISPHVLVTDPNNIELDTQQWEPVKKELEQEGIHITIISPTSLLLGAVVLDLPAVFAGHVYHIIAKKQQNATLHYSPGHLGRIEV